MQAEVAKSVIEQMGSQIDLLVTLALGVCGGIAALFLQIALHNNDGSKGHSIDFKRDWLLFGCLVSEGLSILCGYLSRATITSLTPKLLRLDYSTIDNWTDAQFDGSSNLRFLVGAQAVLFLLGIALVLIFLTTNSYLLKGKNDNEEPKASNTPAPRGSSRGRK